MLAQGFVLLLLLVESTRSHLVGYDCSELKDTTAIDLTSVAPCLPPGPAAPPEPQYGAVIQRVETQFVHLTRCRASYIQTMYRCGMHSHVAATPNTVTRGTTVLDRESCRRAARDGILTLHGTMVPDIKINTTTHISVIIAGSKSEDGTCSGQVKYVFRGVEYKKVVVEREYSITIAEEYALYNPSTNKVRTVGGLDFPFPDLHGSDAEEGEFYWSPIPNTRCDERDFVTIYQGPIDVVTRKTTAGRNEEFAVVAQSAYLFAFRLLINETACGYTVRQTDHPRLFIMPMNPGSKSPFPRSTHLQADVTSYVNSKFLYSELRLADKTQNISSDVVTRRCEAQRQTLLHQLRLARDQPERIAELFAQPGIVGRAVGETLYLARCRPVNIHLRRTEDCYDALPVSDTQNRSLFMTPVEHLLVEQAEPVPCRGPFAPQFYIDGAWYTMDPHPTKVSPPRQLQADDSSPMLNEVNPDVGAAGLYSREEMEQAARFLTFPAARTAIQNTIGRTVSGEDLPSSGLDPSSLFSSDQAARMFRRGLQSLWSWCGALGDIVSSVIGVLFICKVIKYLANIALNALAIREASGCSIAILGAVWTSLTHWIVVRQARRAPAQPEQDHLRSPEHQPLAPVPPPREFVPITVGPHEITKADAMNGCNPQ
jgi:hypothetical protein